MPTGFSRLHVAPHMNDFLSRYPEIRLDVHVSDASVDIVREGFDLAIRIGELQDSSLVARRIAPDTCFLCAAPSYLERRGEPASISDLADHNCLVVDTAEAWKLQGPEGELQLRPRGNARCDSSDFVRELVMSGAGVGILSTWDAGSAIRDGRLRVVLKDYRGAASRAVHAVYPSREFMPAKVDALIDFLAKLYGPVPYWEKDLNLNKIPSNRLAGQDAPPLGERGGAALAAS